MMLISMLLILTFLFLSGLHVYWAFGGKWGSEAVLPTKNENINVIMPGVFITLLVAFGLLSFAGIILLNETFLNIKIPFWLDFIKKNGLWLIAGIFTLRAIGDFKYVGFFKKIKLTKFGQNDTKYYSPLCLVIGVLTLILVLKK